jgi:hypothetical protein
VPILDFGFWILDFGFWILDFGFWILDFGLRFAVNLKSDFSTYREKSESKIACSKIQN